MATITVLSDINKAPTAGDMGLLGAVVELPEPSRLAAKVPVSAEGGHDPPPLARPPSRAPPFA